MYSLSAFSTFSFSDNGGASGGAWWSEATASFNLSTIWDQMLDDPDAFLIVTAQLDPWVLSDRV